MMRRLFQISDRTFIPAITSIEAEQNKINVLRIILGAIVFWRTLTVTYTGYYFFDSLSYLGLADCVITFCFMTGFFTPITILLHLAILNYLDVEMRIASLGSSMLKLTMFGMLILNTGSKYSIDEIFLWKYQDSWLGKGLRKLYQVTGFANPQEIKLVYFLLFFSYGIMSFGAILLHFDDPYWIHGQTTSVLLVSSYLCSQYEFFRALEMHGDKIIGIVSVLSSIIQSAFQLFMIPMVFFKRLYWFPVFWGFLFFLFSATMLNLSYLPSIEICLWLLIFYRGTSTAKIQILYDDYCNLCKNSIRVLRFLDVSITLDYLPLSGNMKLIESKNLNRNEVQEHIHGIYKDKVYVGFDLYYLFVAKNMWLWILLPLFYLAKITRLGYLFYGLVAKNRHALFGTCEVSYVPAPRITESLQVAAQPVMRFLIYVVVTCILLFFPVMPKVEKAATLLFGIDKVSQYKNLVYYTGFQAPVVFNHEDLQMGDRWYVIYRHPKHGPSEFVPHNGLEGERLKYHKSDILYFGNSLRFRRGVLNRDVIFPELNLPRGYVIIKETMLFDYRYTHQKDTVVYAYEIYMNKASKVDLPADVKFKPRKMFRGTFVVFDGKFIETEKK